MAESVQDETTYSIYPKYLDTLTPYHTSPKTLNKSILQPAYVSKTRKPHYFSK